MRARPPAKPKRIDTSSAPTLIPIVVRRPRAKIHRQPGSVDVPHTRLHSHPLSGPMSARKTTRSPKTATVTAVRTLVSRRRLDAGKVLLVEVIEAAVPPHERQDEIEPRERLRVALPALDRVGLDAQRVVEDAGALGVLRRLRPHLQLVVDERVRAALRDLERAEGLVLESVE